MILVCYPGKLPCVQDRNIVHILWIMLICDFYDKQRSKLVNLKQEMFRNKNFALDVQGAVEEQVRCRIEIHKGRGHNWGKSKKSLRSAVELQ